MWTEWVPNEEVLDQKVFPRMIGMACALWEGEDKQPFEDFYTDLQFHYSVLTAFGVQYGLEGIPADMKVIRESGKSLIELSAGVPGLDLKYTYGNSGSINYTQPFEIDKSAPLKIEAFKNGTLYGEPVFDVITCHDALGKTVNYNQDYSPYYTANGEFGLVDGLTGSLNFRDGHWQGFDSVDVDIIIDLEIKQKIKSVSANFYQYNNAWIFFPTNVEVYLSKDGAKWMSLGSVQTDISEKERGKHIFSAILENPKNKKVRYIRFKAKNIGPVPEWHEAAGSDSWIFIDEIIVE
jgi:hexosaminidase